MDSRTCAARAIRAFEDVRHYVRPLAVSSPHFHHEVDHLEEELMLTATSISELFEENQQLKALRTMTFSDGVLWGESDAYCPSCGINHHKAIRLNPFVDDHGLYFCPECFDTYYGVVIQESAS